jgi:hypothetical protein
MRALVSLLIALALLAAATPPTAADQVLASGLYEDDAGPGVTAPSLRALAILPARAAALEPFGAAAGRLGASLEDVAPASPLWTPSPERAPPAR